MSDVTASAHASANALAERLRDALSRPAGAQARIEALLHDRASLAFLGRRVQGAIAVAQELQAIATTAAAAGLTWTAPCWSEGRLLLSAPATRDGPDRGYVLTLHADGDRLIEVQHQRTAPKPAPAAPLVLPSALKQFINQALAERHPMLVAHVDEQGQPQLSFRGSLQVFSDDQLSLWVRNGEGSFIRSIRKNPRIAVMYRNELSKATFHLKGVARIVTGPAERRAIYEASPEVERDHDFAQTGVAVVVDLDAVEGYEGLGPGGQVGRIRLSRRA